MVLSFKSGVCGCAVLFDVVSKRGKKVFVKQKYNGEFTGQEGKLNTNKKCLSTFTMYYMTRYSIVIILMALP